MKFSKVVGYFSSPNADKAVEECQNRLNAAFSELSLGYDNRSYGSKLGGDVFFLQILATNRHVCDLSSYQLRDLMEREREIVAKIDPNSEPNNDLLNEIITVQQAINRCQRSGIFTAATNGTSFYWSPEFVNKLSKIGVRLLACHEVVHTFCSHNSRRGTRNPKLYNISLDFKVNNFLMLDLIARGVRDPVQLFKDNLGDFITFDEYASILRNPFNPPARLDFMNPLHALRKEADPTYIDPVNKTGMYYAERNLPKELTLPEKIYDRLFSSIPKCDVCERVGVYEKPNEYKVLERKLHGKFKPCGHEECCKKCGCKLCGATGESYVFLDPFDIDDEAFDKHMDSELSEDEMKQRVQSAADLAKEFGQQTTGFDELLKSLERPTMTWRDFARIVKLNKKQGSSKRNWMLPKKKPLFSGLYIPTSYTEDFKILCGYDCSASMNKELVGKGLSQLQALKGKGTTIYLVPWSHTTYWSEMVKISGADSNSLLKARVKIDGGTECSSFFNEHHKEVGKVDLIICITDTFLANGELSNVKAPPSDTKVIWLQVERNNFQPKFGKVFQLFDGEGR